MQRVNAFSIATTPGRTPDGRKEQSINHQMELDINERAETVVSQGEEQDNIDKEAKVIRKSRDRVATFPNERSHSQTIGWNS